MGNKWLGYGAIALTLWGTANAQKPLILSAEPALSFADVADFAVASDIVAQVRVIRAERIKTTPGLTLPLDQKRYLITATVTALIRGAGGLPPQIRYLVDVKNDAKGRTPRLKKTEMMLFGVAVPNRSGEIQLIAPDAQVVMSAALGVRVRSILAALNAEDAPPAILGVGDAFHVSGTLSGQGETQIFLNAQGGRPVSLSIWREPGLTPRWAVSLGEIVDQGAAPPPRDTLLWYRLACFLPKTLPDKSISALDLQTSQIVEEDYQTVKTGLGECNRIRLAPSK